MSVGNDGSWVFRCRTETIVILNLSLIFYYHIRPNWVSFIYNRASASECCNNRQKNKATERFLETLKDVKLKQLKTVQNKQTRLPYRPYQRILAESKSSTSLYQKFRTYKLWSQRLPNATQSQLLWVTTRMNLTLKQVKKKALKF